MYYQFQPVHISTDIKNEKFEALYGALKDGATIGDECVRANGAS